MGNLIDRALRHYVVDMFNVLFIDFAVFNVADICVVVGGIAAGLYYLFLWDSWRRPRRSPGRRSPMTELEADR